MERRAASAWKIHNDRKRYSNGPDFIGVCPSRSSGARLSHHRYPRDAMHRARQIETERARVIATRQEGLKVHLRKRSEISWENPFRAFRADAGRFSPQDSVITSRRVRNDDTRGIGITSRPVEILNCCILFRLSRVSRCRKSVTCTQN